MFATLMTSRRFAPLFWCQFFSAFNDNFVRQMLALLILFRMGQDQAGALITLAVGIFILPSLLLSSLGGEMADAHDKALIARRLKFAEIFVQMVAAAGFWFSSLPLLYAALFGLGTLSALFGPVKYGLLPDQLETRELPAGNALVEGATFLAILCGLIAGGYAAANTRSPEAIVVQLMAIALACWGASRFIPRAQPAAPGLRIDPNVARSTWRELRALFEDRRLYVGGLAVSWFWMTGAIALSLVPVVVKARIGGGIGVETGISALFAIGIAVGSIVAAMIAHGRIILLPVPLAGIGMALFLGDLALATWTLPVATQEISLGAFFETARGLRLSIDVALLAFCGGIFVVPAFAAVQAWAGADCRARVIAAVNILNALFMVGGTLIVAALQFIGFGEPALLALLGLTTLAASLWLVLNLPGAILNEFLRLLFKLTFRLEVRGLEHIAAAGERRVIAINHVSFLDVPVILSLFDARPVFAIDSHIAQAWWVRPFLGIARTFPMDPTKAIGTRGLIKEVRKGQTLIIFPEGRITVTGSLMKVYDGAALIADRADAVIVPTRIEGLERTPFSRLTSDMVRRSLFPKVIVTFTAPRPMDLDPAVVGHARRLAAGAKLYDMMCDMMLETSRTDTTLFGATAEALGRFGGSRVALDDALTGPLTARRVRLGSAILSRKLAAMTQPGEHVGLMLPNATGAVVVFLAMQQAGVVPAMLNFTAGASNVRSALETAQIKTVLTSRAFVERAKLEGLLEEIGAVAGVRYLEDIRAGITTRDKIGALLRRFVPLHERASDDPAVILFTSGSEGTPKAVVLSHRNILANIAQVLARFDVTPRDIIFNALPIFHSFGLTGGLLLGLTRGVKVYLYPSPLHYRTIPELVYGANATTLFGTDTFLAGYGRSAHPYDFRSLRFVVAGAERVRPETRKLYEDKFGLRVVEGYGVTETSPVLAVNSPMEHRVGTVGRLMPRVEHRLEAVPGIDDGGRLHVRGPNVMLGYIRKEQPGVIEPPPDGWYDTGDIVTLDEDGYVTIKGRAKRFAKIAGEMVSLVAIEQMLATAWPDMPMAVLALPDARKGERLILATEAPNLKRADVQAALKTQGATDLMAPSEIIRFDKLPLLGSGKTDYVRLAQDLRARSAAAAAE